MWEKSGVSSDLEIRGTNILTSQLIKVVLARYDLSIMFLTFFLVA